MCTCNFYFYYEVSKCLKFGAIALYCYTYSLIILLLLKYQFCKIKEKHNC